MTYLKRELNGWWGSKRAVTVTPNISWATNPVIDAMLYSVFRLSFNPHWSPLSTLRLRNFKSPSQYSRRGNWGFKRWKDSPGILNLGWGKGRIWTLFFQISRLCWSSSPAWWASLYFGPLSCTTLSLLDLQGSATLLHHEPIRFFSLEWHNVSILFI